MINSDVKLFEKFLDENEDIKHKYLEYIDYNKKTTLNGLYKSVYEFVCEFIDSHSDTFELHETNYGFYVNVNPKHKAYNYCVEIKNNCEFSDEIEIINVEKDRDGMMICLYAENNCEAVFSDSGLKIHGKIVNGDCGLSSYDKLSVSKLLTLNSEQLVNYVRATLNDWYANLNCKLTDELINLYEKLGEDSDSDDNVVEICGKKYKTVTIGNQTWLAENLDVETDFGSIVSDRRSENESYGRLYQWDKAVEIANSIEGWHLPTREEWDILYSSVGYNSNKLRSTFGWNCDCNGTDDYGFCILPAGYYNDDSYKIVSRAAFYWTSDDYSYNNSNAYFKSFHTDSKIGLFHSFKTDYHTVRLVKDK